MSDREHPDKGMNTGGVNVIRLIDELQDTANFLRAFSLIDSLTTTNRAAVWSRITKIESVIKEAWHALL